MQDFVGIIRTRKLIDGKLYNRYFVDSNGVEVGILDGVKITTSKGRNVVTIQSHVVKRMGIVNLCLNYTDRFTQEKAIFGINKALSSQVKNLATETVAYTVSKRKEEKTKDNGLPNGINFVFITGTKTKNAFYQFVVGVYVPTTRRFTNTIVYCGTVNTWRSRYDGALEKAIRLRQESIDQYEKLKSF